MTDAKRMSRLKSAWNDILDASQDEKFELFKNYIEGLEAHKERLEEKENRFDPQSSRAYSCMCLIEGFFRRVTGYNAGWVPENFLEHCSDRAGRRAKYDLHTREVNCIFIGLMVARGASETQAMKILMRLRGDAAMTQGQLRELQDSYRDFKKLGRPTDADLSIFHNATAISHFLDFDVSNLEGEEKASEKAVEAFRSFFQELIDLMKDNHKLVASEDSSYPEIFGPVIDWLNAEYEDPLDYFYVHESHKTIPFRNRRRCLTEYINTVHHFTEIGR